MQSVKIVGTDAIVKMELRYQAENALRDGMVINQHRARFVFFFFSLLSKAGVYLFLRGLWYVPEEASTPTVDSNDTAIESNNFEPEIESGNDQAEGQTTENLETEDIGTPEAQDSLEAAGEV